MYFSVQKSCNYNVKIATNANGEPLINGKQFEYCLLRVLVLVNLTIVFRVFLDTPG